MSFYYNCMQTHIGTGMLKKERKTRKQTTKSIDCKNICFQKQTFHKHFIINIIDKGIISKRTNMKHLKKSI